MPHTELLETPMILHKSWLDFFFFSLFRLSCYFMVSKVLSAVELGYDVIKQLIILCRHKRLFS
jgi:hypothetical protein